MTREELNTAIATQAKKHQRLLWQKSGYFYSPFISNFATMDKHEFNSSYYSVYTLASDDTVSYVLVLSYYNGEFLLKCSDAYFDGRVTEDSAKKLINNVLIKIKKDKSTNDSIHSLLTQSYKSLPKSQSCNFNKISYGLAGTMEACDHIANFLNDLPSDVCDNLYSNYFKQLDDSKDGELSPQLKVKFDRYAFRKHILLDGDKGSGKTYSATQWGKNANYAQIFIGGHEQFESIDFLGHYIQQGNGELIWKDGALSQAFRKAKDGDKTILIIDEMLRIPKRELNILISALSSIDGSYVLRTGRALGAKNSIAIEEVIKAPMSNLWVIGTTNIGVGYAVEEMDEALIDRFKPIRKDTTSDELRTILLRAAKKKKFTSYVSKLMDFYEKMNRLHTTKIINKIVNIRHLTEVIELARSEDEIKDIMIDSQLLWVDRNFDGTPNLEQLNAVKSVMRKTNVC